jgi:hypothetical protein
VSIDAILIDYCHSADAGRVLSDCLHHSAGLEADCGGSYRLSHPLHLEGISIITLNLMLFFTDPA